MEVVPRDGYGLLLLVCEFDFRGVEVEVEVGAYCESRCGCGVGDEVDDGLVGFQGSSSPIAGDSGKKSMFYFVPFAGAGWVV